MRLRLIALALALLPGAAVHAAPADEWVMLAPSNHVLPLADVRQGKLQAGILKVLGEALAETLHRPVRFLVLPSRRVGPALEAGEADLLCYVMPHWIDGDFHWTPPVIPNAGIVAGRRDSPPLISLGELSDQPVGTVLGYRYPQFVEALGPRFVRADAPDMASNLAKLAARRMDYAITERMSLRQTLRQHPDWPLVERKVINEFEAPCALSRRSPLTPEAVDAALLSLRRSGRLQRILDPAR